MAKEYIKYDQLIEKIDWDNDLGKWCIYDDDLDSIPAADVAPVRHGKWESEENIFDDNTWICSVCHEPWVLIDGTPKDNYMHYCPNCGCRMDLEG